MPVPLAYKFVATTVMLMEVNHCASRLQLPVALPLKEQDVRVQVFNPSLLTIGFAGRMDTTNYSFSFAKSGRLRFITRLENGFQAYSTTRAQGDLKTTEFLPQLVGVKSVIDAKDAYRLATNWLASIEVDVRSLERAQAPKTEQLLLLGRTPLPIFTVEWGSFERKPGPGMQMTGPAVRVMLSGDTKDILYLRQEDDAYSKRPAELIKDMPALLAISDEEFLKYSPTERSNLISRFAAVDYSTSTKVPPP